MGGMNINHIFKCNQGYKMNALEHIKTNYLIGKFHYDTYHCFDIDAKHQIIWNKAIKVIINSYIRRHQNIALAENHLLAYLQYTLEALTRGNKELIPIWAIMQLL